MHCGIFMERAVGIDGRIIQMKTNTAKHTTTSAIYHWLWYVDSDRFKIGQPFFDRFSSFPRSGDISSETLSAIFTDDDRTLFLEALNRFTKESAGTGINFSGHISDGGGKADFSGQTVDSNGIAPTVVSGQLSLSDIETHSGTINLSDSYLLDLIMRRLPHSIFFKDRDSRFIKISDECAAKFGLAHPDDAIGKTDFDFFDDAHAGKARADEINIMETGKPVIGKIEKEITSGPNPKTLWASTTKLPLRDKCGNITGTFGITTDISEKIEAEKALRASEEKYRSILENIQDVYYRTDRHGIVTDISPSVETYSGLKRSDVIGKPVSDFYYYPTDREKLVRKLRSEGKVSDFEVRFANKKHSHLYTSVSAKVVRDEDDNIEAIVGIMRDITQRKIAGNKLRKAHRFYDQILNNTSEGIYVINSDFEYIYWNKMMETISGIPQADALGKKPSEVFPLVDQARLTKRLKTAMSGTISKSADYYYEIKATGHKGWAYAYYTPLRDENGKVENVLVAISDISDRKHAEEKLRKSDETLTKLSQQVPGAIYQFQQYPDGSSRFPFVSKAFESVYELSPQEVFDDAKKAIKRIYPDDLESVIESINESFETLDPWEVDYRVNLPQRGLRWLRGRARPEKQPDGSVIWHGYISDITDKKQQEKELNDTLNIVSDQNSRLLNFAHIVSHNLRNHAGNISSLLSLIDSETSDEEKEQLFQYLGMASSRLNEAINDLNDIIDHQAGSSQNISECNVSDYIDKIREILSTEVIVHNVAIKSSIPKSTTIDYNPAYLESILLNLISNAIKYRHPERDPKITISLDKTEDGPLLTVRDNGRGIDLEKHRNSLFGMYKTFHGNEDSKGIGLYITKNQVESMGGTIDVESGIDCGTEFKLLLACDVSRLDKETR